MCGILKHHTKANNIRHSIVLRLLIADTFIKNTPVKFL